MKIELSIIIPTYKRSETLRKCLEHICVQTVKDLEVIVVCDGPDPRTDEMIQSFSWPFELQYFVVPKSQQGCCRNRAVERARGQTVLLIGDDIFLTRDACEMHLKAHEKCREQDALHFVRPRRTTMGKKSKVAVLGFTTWDPMLRITPVMKWMERSGVQFGYQKIVEHTHNFLPSEKQHLFTYTSNISLPSRLLYQIKFREDVTRYGWEDIEWGTRLAQEGIPVYYEPDAKAYHHHLYTERDVWERSCSLGESAAEMERLVPQLQITPRGAKRVAYEFFSLLPTYRGKHCRAFLQGMRRREEGPLPLRNGAQL